MTAIHTGPARTVEEMTQSMIQYYGVQMSPVGEEGHMLALGHHEPKRVLAAFNRYSRKDLGLVNIGDDRALSYQDAAENLEWRHAQLITACDDPDHEEDCWQCSEIQDSNWWVDYSVPAGPDSFPVTIWGV